MAHGTGISRHWRCIDNLPKSRYNSPILLLSKKFHAEFVEALALPLGELSAKLTERALSALRVPLP